MQKMPCRDAKKWLKKFASRNETCGWLIKGGKSFLAMYHFRIKSDKKPNGTKISAVKHVEYINREGKFFSPEQWQQKK